VNQRTFTSSLQLFFIESLVLLSYLFECTCVIHAAVIFYLSGNLIQRCSYHILFQCMACELVPDNDQRAWYCVAVRMDSMEPSAAPDQTECCC